MALDLRIPLGLMFVILGCILTATGAFRPTESLGINVNLLWGLVLLAFGTVMLVLAVFFKSASQVKSGVILDNPEHPRPPH
jgi:hypothetical protein